MNIKKKATAIVLVLVVLLAFFLSTDPQKLPSIFLVMPFLVICAVIFLSVKWLFLKRHAGGKKANRIAAVSATLPTLLLVLQSIGQLTFRDVAVVVILFAVSYFYISRNAVSES